MTETKPFPDTEGILLDLLEQIAPTVTATPPDFEPPVIRVNRVGGSVDRLGVTDQARLEVACFGTDREQSRAMNETVRQLVLSCGATSVQGVFVDRAREDTAPVPVPTLEAPDTRRVVSTYVISVRRQ